MDWKELEKTINDSNQILLTTHVNPDGDGLGCALAMYCHLKELNKECRIIQISPMPKEYEFLNKEKQFELYKEEKHDSWLESCDLAIIFDVGDFKRIKKLKDKIIENNIPTINIDHHPHPENHPFNYSIVDISAPATGTIIYDFLTAVRPGNITREMYEGIYTAVLTDTGSFSYSNTTSTCHEIAIDCIDAGVDTHSIYSRIYEAKPKSRIRLLGKIIENITYENNGELAWFTINQTMLDNAQAEKTDVDGFTDFVRSIQGVEVAVMVFENDDDTCRINFRSKGKYTINSVAKSFGGGGHKFAAGALADGNISDIIGKLIYETKSEIEKQSR